MVNKLSTTNEKNSTKKFFSSIVLTGTTLLFLLQPGFSRDNEKVKLAIKETLEHYDTKKYTIQETNNTDNTTIHFEQAQSNLEGGNDVFNFALNNVDKYYPDMKKHLTDMINQFGTDKERKDTVINIFNQTIMTIQDPKQRI
ncbi:MAG: hypothetical protein WCL02_06165 [bacterium]